MSQESPIPPFPDLEADPHRVGMKCIPTGFAFRARLGGAWGSYDLIELKRESLVALLDYFGPCTPWVIGLVVGLLGHPMMLEKAPETTP